VIVGRPAEAAPLAARAKQLDPLEPFRYLSDAMLYLYDGEYGKALESGRDYFEADTANPLAEFVYAWTLISNDRSAEAFSIIDEAAKKTPDNVCTKFGLLLKYSLLKDKDSALREMTPEFQKTCRRDPEWSYCVALTLSLLDAKAEALDWLENAVSRGFVNYPALKREPFLSNIRGEERFAELATRVKREWENFAELDKKSPVRGLRDY
jgi:non-specific serine/threonine protein kinase